MRTTMVNHSTFLLRALPALLLASSSWAAPTGTALWVPDPDKEYIITNMEHKTPLAATGAANTPYQGYIGEVSDDTRWKLVPTGETDPPFYYIERAAGGSKSRLRIGGDDQPDMRPGGNRGNWLKFSLVDSSTDGQFHLDSKANDPHKRLRFTWDGQVKAKSTTATGSNAKFAVREAENIVNDQRWMDTEDNEIEAGKGGQLTKIDGIWYWIGTNPDVKNEGGDLRLYSSETLGEGTWKDHGYLGIQTDADPKKVEAANCKLVKHPDGYYVIVGKGRSFYKSDNVDGPYIWQDPPNVLSNYKKRSTFDVDGNVYDGNYDHKFGGGSLFIDDDGVSAYYVTSRKNKNASDLFNAGEPIHKRDRNVGIYKLQANWLDYEPYPDGEVYWGPNIEREAMFLFKRNGYYYMTASHTSGWKPSGTYMRNATDLSGPWSEEYEMEFVPGGYSTDSHGCQQRYLVDIGDDQWMFGGDRYPVEGPKDWPNPEYGRHVRMPVMWDGNVPKAYWRKEWNVGVYDFATNATEETHSPVPGVPGS